MSYHEKSWGWPTMEQYMIALNIAIRSYNYDPLPSKVNGPIESIRILLDAKPPGKKLPDA